MGERGNSGERVRSGELLTVIDETRALFHRLKAAARALHSRGATTAGQRGVLQELYDRGPRTVPEMARARPVSRQHIQGLVNRLLDAGYVELRANPAHKRSKRVALTGVGREAFEAMREREVELLARLPVHVSLRDLTTTAAVLHDLRVALEDPAWTGLLEREEEGRTQ